MVIAFAFLCILYAFYRLEKKLNIIIEREKETREWLFESLYSINHSVKLPTDTTKPVVKDAIVISDQEDPMSEFDGRRDDWHR